MSTIQQLLKRNTKWAGRRVSIKRRQNDGSYESSWLDVTEYVVSYGSIKKSFGDEVFLGETLIDGMQIVFNNKNRKFNDENEQQSLWNGYLTRYGTRFRVEAFFYDDDGTEVQGMVWYGVSYASPTTSDNNMSVFSIASVLKVFQNYPASGIDVTGSPSTETLIDRLVKKEQNSSRIFDKFLEGSNDSERYQINPDALSVTTISNPSIGDDLTVWNKIVDYSTIDNFFPYINNTGNFVWDKKTNASSTVWEFHGAGSNDTDYGINIISIDEERSGIENLWNRVAIEYETDTYSVSEASWTPGDLSTQDRYGERTFVYSLLELSSREADIVSSSIRSSYENLKREWDITTKFTPHLELKDQCEITYIGEVSVQNPIIFDAFLFDSDDVFNGYQGSINLDGVEVIIIAMEHDLDNFVSRFTLREV